MMQPCAKICDGSLCGERKEEIVLCFRDKKSEKKVLNLKG